ncbi:MAG: hypothetical protein IJQ12_05480 [Lachnospiraceae bacterium]|nr:hypothetical protein [Lachnospiraceae bacterium]
MSERTFQTTKELFDTYYKAEKVPYHNRRGYRMRYIYTGPWYYYGQGDNILRTTKIRMAAFFVSSVLCYLAAALRHAYVNYDRYVSLFGTLALAAVVFELVGVVQFLFIREKTTIINYRDVDMKLRIAPLMYAALMLLTFLMALRYLLISDGAGSAYVIPVMYFLSGVLAVAVYLTYRWIPVTHDG